MQPTLRLAAALLLTASLSLLAAADFKTEALNRFSAIEKKVVGLAEAVPADKYTWRPQEGVRSISEVYLHIVVLNLAVPRMFGTPPPEGFNFRGFDKSTTDKAEIVAKLKESFAHFRKALDKVSGADADKMVKRRRGETTTRNGLWGHMEHLSEHMGQSIAYARANHVTPPWSQER
ncbi:MAG: DinB family protein [bacterium]|nr:DinB family protein [bacterium]